MVTRVPSTVLTDEMTLEDWMGVFIKQILPILKPFEDCWIFAGPTKNGTHGCVKVGGRQGKVLYTHRIAVEAFVRLLFPGEVVMHQCNTPRCCNPYHLKIGTQAENMRYAYATGAVGRQIYEGGRSGIRGVCQETVAGKYEYWVAKADARTYLFRGKDFWEALCARKSWESKQAILPPFLCE